MARSHHFDPLMLAAAASTTDIEAIISNKVRLPETVLIGSKRDRAKMEFNQQRRDKNTLDAPSILLDGFIGATFFSSERRPSNLRS